MKLTGPLKENEIVSELNPLLVDGTYSDLHNPLKISPSALIAVAMVAGLEEVEKNPDAAFVKWMDGVSK